MSETTLYLETIIITNLPSLHHDKGIHVQTFPSGRHQNGIKNQFLSTRIMQRSLVCKITLKTEQEAMSIEY